MTWASLPTSLQYQPVTWQATVEEQHPKNLCQRGHSPSDLSGKTKSHLPGGSKAIPRPHHASPNASASFVNELAANLARLALPLLLQKQNSCANAGCEISWSARAVRVRPRSVGLTRMRSQRPWANKRLPSQKEMFLSLLCVHQLSSPHGQNPGPVGFAAFVWRNRSSSVTHEGFSKNSLAFQKAPSTSYRLTSWLQPSLQLLQRAQMTRRPSHRLPPVESIR